MEHLERVIRLETKLEHHEKQLADTKLEVKELRREVKEEIDEFRKEISSRFDQVMDKLNEINKKEAKIEGGWKTLTIIGAVIGGLIGFIKLALDYLKP